MVLQSNGLVVGVTNDRKNPEDNSLVELSSDDDWKSASVVSSHSIKPSTTVAVTPEGEKYVIEQDFSDSLSEEWKIQKVEL